MARAATDSTDLAVGADVAGVAHTDGAPTVLHTEAVLTGRPDRLTRDRMPAMTAVICKQDDSGRQGCGQQRMAYSDVVSSTSYDTIGDRITGDVIWSARLIFALDIHQWQICVSTTSVKVTYM